MILITFRQLCQFVWSYCSSLQFIILKRTGSSFSQSPFCGKFLISPCCKSSVYMHVWILHRSYSSNISMISTWRLEIHQNSPSMSGPWLPLLHICKKNKRKKGEYMIIRYDSCQYRMNKNIFYLVQLLLSHNSELILKIQFLFQKIQFLSIKLVFVCCQWITLK